MVGGESHEKKYKKTTNALLLLLPERHTSK